MAEHDTDCLIDGAPASGLPPDDRGLAYGDGLFETVLVHRGEPVWWPEHLDRLRDGAVRLGIAAPDDSCWDADRARLLVGSLSGDVILKLILTRGSSRRGYRAEPVAGPRRLALRLCAPTDSAIRRRNGIRARWCALRLAAQPHLAGLKHLNRLEQVLARAEWQDADIDEGLLRDQRDAVICATAGNLFVVRDQRLLTPRLEQCGIAGVCRRWLLANALVEQRDLTTQDVQQADELFVCNSVRGILPVVALGDRSWPIGPLTRDLMTRLALAQPAFSEDAR